MIITVACCTKCQRFLFLIANHFGSPRSVVGRSVAIGRRSVGRDRSWPKGRSAHRVTGLTASPNWPAGPRWRFVRVRPSASVRLTALPPTPPLELSCLIRIIPRSDRPSLSLSLIYPICAKTPIPRDHGIWPRNALRVRSFVRVAFREAHHATTGSTQRARS